MELGLRRDGYPALAEWISRDSDYETFIFRRYDRLAARNILNLQSELATIEARLDKLDEDSRQRRDPGLRCWETFEGDCENEDNPDHKAAVERRELFDRLERRMKDYQKALLRQVKIAQISRPRSRPLSIFRDWFHGRGQPGMAKPILVGASQKVLDPENEQDLLAIKSATDTDLVSQILQDHWPSRGKQFNSSHSTSHFEEKHVTWAVAAISTIVAAGLFIGSIAVLNRVTDSDRRIGCIAGFTLMFALSIAILTNARRVEIFAATAAYVAVLVVFVSGNQVAPTN